MKNRPDMRPSDDLLDYLEGGTELSRAYQRESAPDPAHLLDRRVLEIARGSRASTCLAPLALAASILLSVALVLAMLFGPTAGNRHEEEPRLIRVAANADLHGSSLAERLQAYGTETPPEPGRWLAEIGALRRAGRTREADAELRRFRLAYPGYPIGAAAPP